ncbi:hypothetical protein D3C79_639490 [compost metagenome]
MPRTTGTGDHQFITHGRQHAAHCRVTWQSRSVPAAVCRLGRHTHTVYRIHQRVIGIDERLHRLFQALSVGSHGDADRAERFGLGQQFERHATDRVIDLVRFAGELHAIDIELGIFCEFADTASTARIGHLRCRVDGQVSDPRSRDVRTFAHGFGAQHQPRTGTVVNDVGGEALAARLGVDRITRLLQRSVGRNGHIEVDAILGDGQRATTGGNNRAAVGETLTGYTRRRGQLGNLDRIAAVDCRTACRGLDVLVVGGGCRRPEKRRVGTVVKLLQRRLVGGQRTFEATHRRNRCGVRRRAAVELALLGSLFGINQGLHNGRGIETGTQPQTR